MMDTESLNRRDSRQRVLFYLPGTAGWGHLSRAVTLATALRHLDPTIQILFITEAGDTRLAKEVNITCLSISSIAPYMTLVKEQRVKDSISEFSRLSIWQALIESVIASFHPTIVLHDTYVMETVKKAAQKCHAIQVVVWRQAETTTTKRTDERWLQGLDLILIPHPPDEYRLGAISSFPPDRIVFTGNLVRRTCSELTPDILHQSYGILEDEFVVVATNGGGNQPVKTPTGETRQHDNFLQVIDQAICILHRIVPEKQRIRVIFVTGPLAPKEQPLIQCREINTITFTVQEYEPDLPDLLAAAHVAICRGGYNTISDVTAIGVPTLAIPVLNIFDDQTQRIAWAMTQHPYLQACSLNPEEIAQHLCRLIEQPWWHFTPRSPEKDLPFQQKLAAAQKLLDCQKFVEIV